MIDTEKYVKNFKMQNPWTKEEMNMTCEYDTYAAGGIALTLYCDGEEGYPEPYCTASVCIPCALYENEIAIKDYSENEGILKALLKNKVINKPHRYLSSGFARIPVCTLREVKKRG